MKKLFIFMAVFMFSLVIVPSAFAVSETTKGGNATTKEEAEGKDIWDKLIAKQISCEILKDDDFELLGEYFMGQMHGSSHEFMNAMMERMMGKDKEEQMHIAMGKRMSACDASVAMPSGIGMMSMMNMMGGLPAGQAGWSSPSGLSDNFNYMMGFGYSTPFMWIGGILMFLFWVAVIVGIVALVRWLINQTSGKMEGKSGKSALDILKERYAKGEIDKKEFEEKYREIKNL